MRKKGTLFFVGGANSTTASGLGTSEGGPKASKKRFRRTGVFSITFFRPPDKPPEDDIPLRGALHWGPVQP